MYIYIYNIYIYIYIYIWCQRQFDIQRSSDVKSSVQKKAHRWLQTFYLPKLKFVAVSARIWWPPLWATVWHQQLWSWIRNGGDVIFLLHFGPLTTWHNRSESWRHLRYTQGPFKFQSSKLRQKSINSWTRKWQMSFLSSVRYREATAVSQFYDKTLKGKTFF